MAFPEAYHLSMHRMRNESVVPDSDGSVASDVLLRQEPDEDDEDDDDEGDGREKDEGDGTTDDGYSE